MPSRTSTTKATPDTTTTDVPEAAHVLGPDPKARPKSELSWGSDALSWLQAPPFIRARADRHRSRLRGSVQY